MCLICGNNSESSSKDRCLFSSSLLTVAEFFSLSLCLSLSITPSLSLSLSLFVREKQNFCRSRCCLPEWNRIENEKFSLSHSFGPPLSLSFSHTHTLSLSLSPPLSNLVKGPSNEPCIHWQVKYCTLLYIKIYNGLNVIMFLFESVSFVRKV